MGALPHLLSVLKIKETKNNPPMQKRGGEKNNTELCMTKYITYIDAYIKPGLISQYNNEFYSKLLRST